MSNRKVEASDEAARLNTLVMQGRIILNTMNGLSVLSMCLQRHITYAGQVDADWIVPALEVLRRAATEMEEWWDERLDVAEGGNAEEGSGAQ